MARRQRRLSIFAVLLSGVLLSSVGGVGMSLYFGVQTTIENTRDLWITMTSADLANAERAVENRITRLANRNRWIASKIAEGRVDPKTPSFWIDNISSLIASETDIAAIGLTTPDGDFFGYDPKTHQFLNTKADLLDGILAEQLPLFGPGPSQTLFPYWQSALRQVVIGEAIPVFQNGQYLGLLIQYLTLPGLSRTLPKQEEGDGRTAFIIVDDHIIAHPSLSNWQRVNMRADDTAFVPKTIEETTSVLPRIDEIGDAVLAQRARWHPVDLGNSIKYALDQRLDVSQVQINSIYSIIVTRDALQSSAVPITFGMHFEPSVFETEGRRIDNLIMIGAAVLLSALIGAAAIAHYFSRPLRRFSSATRQLEDGDLRSLPKLPSSIVTEFNDAATSFNHMVATLNDRERIGRLFGKFLPPAIAEQLLASESDAGTIAPHKCVASILFVDLQGFTSMSEKADPQDVVDTLNAYFADATAIIENNKGIITQYQGDAILAVFNAVGELPDHADAALETAISLQELVHAKQFNGITLRCRCGVNTGELVAGSVGAPDRLSFTVNGDAVNSAARLEAMNKELGTKILIGETTRNQLSDPSRAFLAKEVLLRGRSETTAVYTVTLDGID
ncbi:adenylate/guanylate cyclase domain-containing protein [Thalassospira sp.]|uniref:adenylate/guanylate cyclase domain-containing protein n=1 Tax=Thalassospira sp. TaxID=1912094 RepID=UPI0032ED80CD